MEPPFAGKKHRGKAALNWGSLGFRSLVHYHRGRAHGGMQAGPGAVAESYILVLMIHMQREALGLTWVFETSKPTPSDLVTATRPHLLILLILSNSTPPW